MNPRFILVMLALGSWTVTADAGLLHMEFAGGGSEVTMGQSDTVQVDVIWTMHATDTAKNFHNGINLRFNVNDVADPDGTDRNHKFVVQSVNTPLPGWSTAASNGVGGFFSEGFFLSAVEPDGTPGVPGNGTEFEFLIASFVLHKADPGLGNTYITFRHLDASDPLPDATYGEFVNEWNLRWQTDITGPGQFDIGLGNPGDGGPQWDPVHGYETFQPLIIHNVPEPSAFCLLAVGVITTLHRRRTAGLRVMRDTRITGLQGIR